MACNLTFSMASFVLVVTHFTDAIRKQAEHGNLTGCEFIDLSGMVH